MSVDAKSVMELRKKTGLPMMDCKRALVEADGDGDKAYENLRKAGLKAVEKLSDRAADDGRVGAAVSDDGRVGALVVLRCETEPVAKNEKFVEILEQVTALVVEKAPADSEALGALKLASGETVEEARTELVNQIRENINLGSFERFESDAVVQYLHFDLKKAGMVAFKGGSAADAKVAEVGKDVCMHIVSQRPAALRRDRLDPAVIENEREIQLAQMKADPKNAKKPEEILKKIIEGKMDKFIASLCLLEQPFVKNPDLTVEQYVAQSGGGIELVDFAYAATDQ